ncbi:MAG: Stp1/IreP family PP2C-type Ser/Thr phosphatase [Armatimonadota bacterium]|nr:Stp1/IreP family PP2C-type Ser/Thr phosphatase [Armatimonadota bacterium]
MQNTPSAPSAGGEEEREITAPLDVQSLRQGWERLEARVPRWHVRLTVGAKSDLGRVRENNEDKFDILEPEDPAVLAARGRFYAVADGMGGHAAGQIAAELALKSVIRRYFGNTTDDLETALISAVQYANGLVRDTAAGIPGRSGMGTTLTAAVVHENRVVVAHVGDSRLYLIRGGEIRQVTNDHSWVAEQVRMGLLDAETAARSPFRNVITRSMGAEPTVAVDLFHETLQPGDILLLCTDGLTGHLSDPQLAAIATATSPSVACMELIDAANEAGGKDNITVLIARVDAIEPYAAADKAQPAPEPTTETAGSVDPPPAPDVGTETRRRFGLFGRR